MWHRVFIAGLLCAGCCASATDERAVEAYDAGHALYEKREFHDAADKFREAELEADDSVIRSNSLLAQIGSYRMCGLLYKEFEAIERLLDGYPEHADSAAMAKREYEIAEDYNSGKRDPAFWALRFIPWLNNGDKSAEVYAKALSRAPFAEWAPRATLRLAYKLDQDGRKKESVELLRNLVANHPASDVRKYALLSLINGLLDLSESGDGDGAYINEAMSLMKDFKSKFPDAPENAWVDSKFAMGRDIQAKRLHDIADFYRNGGRNDAAERYLSQVLTEFPDSKSAVDSEKMMHKMDLEFDPSPFPADRPPETPRIRAFSVPAEAKRILLEPGQNGNHYLIPVPDFQEEEIQSK